MRIIPAAKANQYLTEREVAALAAISRSWLQKMRMGGCGPTYYKLGRAVRYLEADVQAWLAAQRA